MLRRFTAVLLTAVMALVSIGAGDPACAAAGAPHRGRVEAASLHHTTMPAMSHALQDAAVPPAGSTPCDHQSMARECATMVSCVSVVAEAQSMVAGTPEPASGHASVVNEAAPHSPAFTPDTPPPRA